MPAAAGISSAELWGAGSAERSHAWLLPHHSLRDALGHTSTEKPNSAHPPSPGCCSLGMESSRGCPLCFPLGLDLFSLGLSAGSWSAGMGSVAEPRAGVGSASSSCSRANPSCIPTWHLLLAFPALCPACVPSTGLGVDVSPAKSSSSRGIFSRGSWKRHHQCSLQNPASFWVESAAFSFRRTACPSLCCGCVELPG